MICVSYNHLYGQGHENLDCWNNPFVVYNLFITV